MKKGAYVILHNKHENRERPYHKIPIGQIVKPVSKEMRMPDYIRVIAVDESHIGDSQLVYRKHLQPLYAREVKNADVKSLLTSEDRRRRTYE